MKKKKKTEDEFREICRNSQICKKKKCSTCKDIYDFWFIKHQPTGPIKTDEIQKYPFYKTENELDDPMILTSVLSRLQKSFVDAILLEKEIMLRL